MLRFLAVATLSVLTSGCLLVGVMAVPPRGGSTADNDTASQTAAQSGPSKPAATPASPVASDPSGTVPSGIVQRFLGTWLAEDTSTGLDRVTFSKYPPETPNPNANGGKVEAAVGGRRVLGDFLISGNQLALQFPGENPVVFEFSFLGDGRLRIGQALYSKG